ncbi:MAG: hypothetical protein QM638_05830 [Nocardioides sp.]|uniref:hypothetical protein n=1 Tax=Nocardioides sp. TaxID=35761 RepID=UPI0039E43FA6
MNTTANTRISAQTNAQTMPVPLFLDVVSLTMTLINIDADGGPDGSIADAIDATLRPLAHLRVDRVGDTVVASTDDGHPERILVTGRLDPRAGGDHPLAYVEMGRLFGPSACRKGGMAVMLKSAAAALPGRDVTFVFHGDEAGPEGVDVVGTDYSADCAAHCAADFAVLLGPTEARVEGTPHHLEHPAARRLLALTEAEPIAPRGTSMTDLNVPSVGFGPGDPALARTPEEYVPTAQLTQCEFVLREWLRG